MTNEDRRSSPRFSLQVPIRFRGMKDSSKPEGYLGETANISRSGLFFVAQAPLPFGSIIQLTLRIPRELSGRLNSVVQCLGEIVRVESFADGSVGYGARVDLLESASVVHFACEPVKVMATASSR